jgi:hypothetical protein
MSLTLKNCSPVTGQSNIPSAADWSGHRYCGQHYRAFAARGACLASGLTQYHPNLRGTMVLSFSVTDMACNGTKCPVDFHVDDMRGRRLGSFKACKTCRIVSGLSHVRLFLNPSVCHSQALPPA